MIQIQGQKGAIWKDREDGFCGRITTNSYEGKSLLQECVIPITVCAREASEATFMGFCDLTAQLPCLRMELREKERKKERE
jgi:hypothetical protein